MSVERRLMIAHTSANDLHRLLSRQPVVLDDFNRTVPSLCELLGRHSCSPGREELQGVGVLVSKATMHAHEELPESLLVTRQGKQDSCAHRSLLLVSRVLIVTT